MAARFFDLLFAQADRSQFGPGVDDVGHGLVIDVTGVTGDGFGDRDAFFLGLVREHEAGNQIANGGQIL